MSRSCFWFWIILSSLVLLFMLLVLSIAASVYIFEMHILKAVFMMHCRSFKPVREIFQRGDYWVMQNFAFSEKAVAECEGITFAMQGTYSDIYKLEEFFLVPNYKEIISFAIYVPNREHYKKTLVAIDYAQNQLHNNNETWIYFHLYFRIGQMPLSKKDDSNFTFENQPVYFDTAAQQEQVRIVGRNIAVEAAVTKYHIQSDISAYPAQKFAHKWVMEALFTRTNELFRDYKVIWRVPTILVSNLQRNQHFARTNVSQLAQETTTSANFIDSHFIPFDQVHWLNDHYNDPNKMITKQTYSFEENLKQLLAHKSLFISNAQMPILEERLGLTLEISEQLLIIQLTLQDYEFLPLYRTFFLYDIGNVTYYMRNFKVNNKSQAILNEYAVMYPSDKCLRDIICKKKSKIQN